MNTGGASDILTNEHCAPTAIHYTGKLSLANGAVRGAGAGQEGMVSSLGVDYAFGQAMSANITEFVQAGGGKVVGSSRNPLNAGDLIVPAAGPGLEAPVIVLANATSDTVNTIKAANEFGITKDKTIVPSIMFINDIHALGLKHGQGMVFTTGFYWNRNDDTRLGAAFSAR